MSEAAKKDFDVIFKLFIAVMITFFGWLGNRTVQQFDAVEKSIEAIRINNEGMGHDIEWLKIEVAKKR